MTRQATAAQALRIKLISAAVASCFAAGAHANPTGGAPVTGVSSITALPGNVLEVITNAPKSIINWQTFSINLGEATRFQQPSASSAVLNRVVTTNPSDISGTLWSNGRVFLINPNGIVFGGTAVVDVAGLVASSLEIANGDFLDGRMLFQQVPGSTGTVANYANISVPAGGQVYLVGPAVTNGGVIASPQGEVVLAAGNSVELINTGTPGLGVSITAPDNQALNMGQIFADSGRVGIFAGVVNQGGTVNAGTAVVGVNGSIKLVATDSATFAAGSNTFATGNLDVQAGNLTVNSGVFTGPQAIDVSGALTVQPGAGGAALLIANGDQTINAGSILLQGGSSGNGNSASITAVGGSQTVNAGAGGITLIGGSSTGTNNFAQISQATLDPAFTQTVNSAGPVLLDSGDAGAFNFTIIRAFGGHQSLDAGSTTLMAGAGGAANFAAIQAQSQDIHIQGDLAMVGGGSTSSGTSGGGAQMGGRGGAALSATNLALAVDGNLTLSGGTVSGSVIGQGLVNNEPTNAAIEVGGNVALNPGTAPGATARIGARLDSFAGGDISITAGGGIALNSNSPNNYSLIRTADDVTLTAQQVTQGPDAKIQANTLAVNTQQGTSLIGANSVNMFSATNALFGDVALNNSSALLTLPAVQNFGGAFQLNHSGDLLVTGFVNSGPQAISATGTLTVRGDAFSSGQLSAFGGQTISAHAIDVVAQDGGSAFIINGSGDQVITVQGGGASAGLDVRTEAGSGGVASIQNNAFGATQLIQVTDADHISVNGVGSAGASIFAIPGSQVISITGSGANAIHIGSTGAQGFSNLGASHQTMTAGAPGQSGSITIIGSDGNQRLAGLVSQPGVGNSQTVSTSGALTIIGGSAPAQLTNFPAGIFHNGTGQQTISAQSIVLQGGGTGVNNSAQIGANNGTQLVNAGSIVLVGGAGGTGNSAQLRANQGPETILAGELSLTAGAGGTNNFAAITGPTQSIALTGDLTISGGGSLGTPGIGGGARIGGRGGAAATPTQLALTVGGDVTLNGGTVAGAAIGSNTAGGQPTTITMYVGGDVTLNPGAVADAGTRIGSPSANVAGGDIFVNAGGTIALNSAGAGNGGAIRTADNVTLNARQIAQGSDALIQANALTANTQQGASLIGANSVNTFSAVNTTFGDIVLNNGSATLTLPAVQNTGGAFQLYQSGDLLVTGFVNSGPQAISATGTLTVRGDAFSSGQLNAFGGQTISAHAIDVVAQDGGSAFIMNNGSGDQSILVSGAGTSAGVDVRTLSGFGVASIQNLAPGATQSVIVTDADHISVQGIGTTAANINAIGGTQLISITGSGANAVNLGTAGAQGASQLVASNQSLVAGASGEAGSITIVGSAGNQRLAGLVSQPGAGNSQTVSTSGTLSIVGGSAPAQLTNFPAGLFHNGTGQQTISAQSIVLQGGGTGVNNSAQIGANNGTQLVNAGSITLVGGPDGTGNGAQIRTNQGLQTIVAGELSLTAGAGGTNNFAAITGPTQDIAVAGDLTITGGGSLGTPGVGGGARIGGRGGAAATPTQLALTVGGDVTLNGGTVSGSAIGSSPDGGQPTQITMNVGGDVTLNPGSATGSRIGSPSNNVAGGEIVVNAGGTIALNSAGPGNAGAIRTTDGVTLSAQSITQGPDAVIQANTLTLETQQGASLIGANAVNSLSAVNTASGAVAFNNASPLLTVTGIDQVSDGTLALNQSGNLLIGGDVASGAQTINATGDIIITPGDGPGVTVQANGAQTFSAGGNFSLLGGTGWNGFAQSLASGSLQVSTGGNLTVQGGSGLLAYSLLYGGDEVRLTVGNELHVNGGASPFAFGRVQTGFWDTIYLSFPNRESGGYFVNGVEGARVSGLDGFFTGLRPAVLGRSLLVDYGI